MMSRAGETCYLEEAIGMTKKDVNVLTCNLAYSGSSIRPHKHGEEIRKWSEISVISKKSNRSAF